VKAYRPVPTAGSQLGGAAAADARGGHKKTVSESETVAGQQSEKSNGNAKGNIRKTNGSEDLAAHSRLLAKQGAALRQQVFWLKHGAKLRHCYESVGQIR
jgi:hypothetical protein